MVQLERAALQYVVGKDEEGYAVPVVQGRMISPEEVRQGVAPRQAPRMRDAPQGMLLTRWTPWQVGTFLLRRMKTVAQDAGSVLRRVFGFKFKSVTVSVPVSFSHDQKAATVRRRICAGWG